MADRATQSDTHIDQMRELMFGPQIREFRYRLEQLESTLALFQEGSRKRVDELNDNILSELHTAVSSSDKKIRGLDAKTGEERADLRAQVEQLDENVTARLDKLETELTTFQEESRKRFDTLHENLTSSLNGAIEASDKRMQAIASKVQNEEADLRKQARRTEEKLEVRFQSLNEELESNAAHIRNELVQIRKGVKDELQGLSMKLSEELNKRFREVRDSKVSKDDISEILFEFGMRIKGMDFVSDVPQLPAAREASDD